PMWFIYTMEYYAAEKNNDFMKFAGKWMELENVILSEIEMGPRQRKSTYNNTKNKTTPESSPPPTPRPEHCNVDKVEENDPKKELHEDA
ncbi:hypothetical protein STEG23_001520, partial [Scotinomys teguina]